MRDKIVVGLANYILSFASERYLAVLNLVIDLGREELNKQIGNWTEPMDDA
jgi:hypothetical protein